ncbi:MAG: sigma 54-interacting transcriptional regulator [Thermodesulfobacteriota bacterium]
MSVILVVDDDFSLREFLEIMLSREGYQVLLAADGREALTLADRTTPDLVITDIRMKNMDGLEVLKGIKTRNPETVVILISAYASVETAVTAMKEGAYDFIPKPFNIEELKAVIKNALALRTPEAERKVLKEKVKEGCHFGSLVGLSPEMVKVYDLIRRAAQTATNILITGESGTGKELVARAIHDNSPRTGQPFVTINCGGMPEQLIESELFGYKKGAFTGAAVDKPGLFELAHKGTIFLDELAELSLPMQVKLLRVVQDKTYRAVGGTQEHTLDVRFIAATNKDLEAEVMAGRFREDLYYRMNVINIHLPSLRERKSDIPLLAHYFLDKYNQALDKDVKKISAFALDILANYHFPGNVRELENIIERCVALEQSSIVLPESLTLAAFKQERRLDPTYPRPAGTEAEAPPTTRSNLEDALAASKPERHPAAGPPGPAAPETRAEPRWSSTAVPRLDLEGTLAALEKGLLLKALSAAKGSRDRAAELLKTNPRNLRYRLSKYGLQELSWKEVTNLLRQETGINGPFGLHDQNWSPEGLDLDQVLSAAEKEMLTEAIKQAHGSKSGAAKLLGLTFRSFRHRLAKFE